MKADSAPYEVEELEWEFLGGPLGGLGYDIRINPENTDIMYVTDALAGAFKSTNAGRNWFTINEGLDVTFGPSGDNIPVFCLTIDPHDPDTVWCGMQDQKGIFKSTNAGKTWKRMDNGIEGNQGITFRGITVHPEDPDIVYAAGEVSSYVWADEPKNGVMFDKTKGMVYKTVNGGRSWERVWYGDNLARYIWINPENPDVVYVSTGIFDREAANSDPDRRRPGGVGIVKSTDGGESWTVQDHENGLECLYISSLFMHPEDPDVLIAGTGHDYYSRPHMVRGYPEPQEGGVVEKGGVFITTDGGETWERTLEAEMITAVEFCTANPDIAYAVNEYICYVSRDRGRTWEKTQEGTGKDHPYGPKGVMAGFPMDFAVDPHDASRLFVNNYGGGNFYSEDGGETWTMASKGYTGAIVNGGIAIHPSDPSTFYVGARSGLFRSSNGGGTFHGLAYPPARLQECTALAMNPKQPELVMAGYYSDLARSTNGGKEWKMIDIPIKNHVQIKDLTFAPSNPEIMYCGSARMHFVFERRDQPESGHGIWKSADGGRTWRQSNDDLSRDANVVWITVHPDDPSLLYAATLTKGILKSEDGGESWEQIFYNNSRVHAVTLHPRDDQKLLAATVGGVYLSRNGGEDWEHLMKGMDPEARVTFALFDRHKPDRIWASEYVTGIHYLDLDDDAPWIPVNRGLQNKAVYYLQMSSGGNHIYAATNGKGMFRLDLDGEAPE